MSESTDPHGTGKTGMEILGYLTFIVLIVIYGGWVLHLLWNWFAAPLAHLRLGLAQTIGLSALLSNLKGYPARNDDRKLSEGLIFITLLLAIGWIAHLCGG